MATVDFHQGERIPFTLNFGTSINPDINSFDDLDEVIVYVYTNRLKLLKYSTIVKAGYLPLYKLIPTGGTEHTIVAGYISAEDSALMPIGDLYCEIMCKEGLDTGVNAIKTGIRILTAQIKIEA